MKGIAEVERQETKSERHGDRLRFFVRFLFKIYSVREA